MGERGNLVRPLAWIAAAAAILGYSAASATLRGAGDSSSQLAVLWLADFLAIALFLSAGYFAWRFVQRALARRRRS